MAEIHTLDSLAAVGRVVIAKRRCHVGLADRLTFLRTEETAGAVVLACQKDGFWSLSSRLPSPLADGWRLPLFDLVSAMMSTPTTIAPRLTYKSTFVRIEPLDADWCHLFAPLLVGWLRRRTGPVTSG